MYVLLPVVILIVVSAILTFIFTHHNTTKLASSTSTTQYLLPQVNSKLVPLIPGCPYGRPPNIPNAARAYKNKCQRYFTHGYPTTLPTTTSGNSYEQGPLVPPYGPMQSVGQMEALFGGGQVVTLTSGFYTMTNGIYYEFYAGSYNDNPNQGFVAYFYTLLTGPKTSAYPNGSPWGPIYKGSIFYDPVVGGTMTITSVVGTIAYISDVLGNKYEIDFSKLV